MASLVTHCPKCSQPNEVYAELLRSRMSTIGCWSCAAIIPLDDKEVEKALKTPPPREGDLERLLVEAGRDGGGESKRRVVVLALAIALPVSMLGIFWTATSVCAGGESIGGGGQFRARYHLGDEAPRGTEAWKASVEAGADFAPARSGDLLIVAANESRAKQAAEFTPLGAPEDILPRLRELHEKMLSLGFEIEGGVRKTALAAGQQEIVRQRLEKGSCYTIAAFGSGSSRNVDLIVFDTYSTRPIISDTRFDLDSVVDHCAETTGEHQVQIQMKQGGGIVSIVTYRRTRDVLHEKGHVSALDRETGEVRWRAALEDQVSSSPAASDEVVVVGTRTRVRSAATQVVMDGGALRVLDASDGSARCFFDADGPVLSSPILDGGLAFVGSCGQAQESAKRLDACGPGAPVPSHVYAVKTRDCNEAWSVPTPTPVLTDPTTDGSRVYVTTGSTVMALDAATGTVVWQQQLGGVLGSPVVFEGMVVVGSVDRTVRALDADDGEVRWTFSADAAMAATPAISEDTVFAGSEDGSLYAIELESGNRVWDVGLSDAIASPLSVAAGLVLVGTADRVTAIDARSGTTTFQVQVEAGLAPACSPILVNGLLIFPDRGGTVHAIR
jgi:outer membrane protein assembly factor BamB